MPQFQTQVTPSLHGAEQYRLGAEEARIGDARVFRVADASSGKVLVQGDSYESWVGGTGQNGEYIPPHCRGANGEILPISTNNNVRITEIADLVRLLELEPTSSATEFKRPGYSGTYLIQNEADGTLSVHYTGGRHLSGKICAAQTFHHGQWDPTRRFARRDLESAPQPSQPDFGSITLPPMPVNQPTALPGLAPDLEAVVPERPLFNPPSISLSDNNPLGIPLPQIDDRSGEYHFSDAYNRERNTLRATTRSAAGIVPPEELAQLSERYRGESVEMATPRSQELFEETLALANDHAARRARVAPAPDSLRATLGLPEGTTVLVAKSGPGPNLGEPFLSEAFNRAFGDTIRIRGFQPPVASADDVVLLQAHNDGQGGPTFMRMSVIQGRSEDRSRWSVTSYDATHRGNPERYIQWSVSRNPDETTVSFPEWQTAQAHWFQEGSPALATFESAFTTRNERLAEQARAAEQAERERQARAAAAAQQSEVFAQVSGSHYRMNYQGTIINDIQRSNLSMSAAETRTGTFTVEPDANITFQTQTEDGSTREVTLRSQSQLARLPEAERKMFEFALSTPCEGNAERSISRVVDLFPADVYRPGWAGSFVYPPRWYRRELVDALVAQYPSGVAEQRRFLQGLYRELQRTGGATEDSVESIPARLAR